MKKIFDISILFVVISFNHLSAQRLEGTWHALFNFSSQELRFTIHIENDSVLTITGDSPDQDSFGFPLPAKLIESNKFEIALGNQKFKCEYYPELEQIFSIYTSPTYTTTSIFRRTPLTPPAKSIVRIKEKYNKKEVYIPMRDSVKLFTSIYSPKDTTKAYPILIWRTPYNSEPSETSYSNRLTNITHFLNEGYIIVYQDVRGKYLSEGEFVDVRPFIANKRSDQFDENSDTYETIEWLVKNVSGNNGNVGILGISYPGFYSTLALPHAHPNLKAVSPQAPVTDSFIGDDDHHNGAFFLMDDFNFYFGYGFGIKRPLPTRLKSKGFNITSSDNYSFYKNVGPIKNYFDKYLGDSIQFWNELRAHPNYDNFWKDQNPIPHLKNVKPAVYVVGGWFDAEDLWGTLATYKAIEKQNPGAVNHLIMGPWYHGQWASDSGEKLGNIHFGAKTSSYFKEKELAFFNYYLKNEGNLDLPEASIFITGENNWHEFNSWPPKNIQKKKLFLQPNERLSFDIPTLNNSYDEYIVDPNKPVPYTEDVHLNRTREYMVDDQRFASRRPDVMVYQTEELTEDITLTGPVNVDFYVSTTGTDADYVVKIIDVFPDTLSNYPTNQKQVPMEGYQMLVRGEVLRGKYRNSFENPEPFNPKTITEISYKIPDVAHTFKKGHRIMIQVQNTWFPLVDINPQQFLNIYEADEEDFLKATHRIYHDKKYPSNIVVYVLPDN